jgi:hypothetical protein
MLEWQGVRLWDGALDAAVLMDTLLPADDERPSLDLGHVAEGGPISVHWSPVSRVAVGGVLELARFFAPGSLRLGILPGLLLCLLCD